MRSRVTLLTGMFLLATLAGMAMIATLKLPDLVRQSEFICVAKVVKVSEIAVDKDQISTVKNVLLPEKVLKGTWAKHEPIVLMTRQCGKAGQVGWMEDQVTFPPKGNSVMLFLRKREDGSLETVNTIQGLWPLNKGKPEGMGIGFTIKQIKEIIKQQRL